MKVTVVIYTTRLTSISEVEHARRGGQRSFSNYPPLVVMKL